MAAMDDKHDDIDNQCTADEHKLSLEVDKVRDCTLSGDTLSTSGANGPIDEALEQSEPLCEERGEQAQAKREEGGENVDATVNRQDEPSEVGVAPQAESEVGVAPLAESEVGVAPLAESEVGVAPQAKSKVGVAPQAKSEGGVAESEEGVAPQAENEEDKDQEQTGATPFSVSEEVGVSPHAEREVGVSPQAEKEEGGEVEANQQESLCEGEAQQVVAKERVAPPTRVEGEEQFESLQEDTRQDEELCEESKVVQMERDGSHVEGKDGVSSPIESKVSELPVETSDKEPLEEAVVIPQTEREASERKTEAVIVEEEKAYEKETVSEEDSKETMPSPVESGVSAPQLKLSKEEPHEEGVAPQTMDEDRHGDAQTLTEEGRTTPSKEGITLEPDREDEKDGGKQEVKSDEEKSSGDTFKIQETVGERGDETAASTDVSESCMDVDEQKKEREDDEEKMDIETDNVDDGNRGHVTAAEEGGHVTAAGEGGHVTVAEEGGHVTATEEGGHVTAAEEDGHVTAARAIDTIKQQQQQQQQDVEDEDQEPMEMEEEEEKKGREEISPSEKDVPQVADTAVERSDSAAGEKGQREEEEKEMEAVEEEKRDEETTPFEKDVPRIADTAMEHPQSSDPSGVEEGEREEEKETANKPAPPGDVESEQLIDKEDVKENIDRPSETKVETESERDDHADSAESGGALESVNKQKEDIPSEIGLESKSATSQQTSPPHADMETGNVTLAPSDSDVGSSETDSDIQASKEEEPVSEQKSESSFEAISLPIVESTQDSPDKSDDEKKHIDTTEDRLQPSLRESGGQEEEREAEGETVMEEKRGVEVDRVMEEETEVEKEGEVEEVREAEGEPQSSVQDETVGAMATTVSEPVSEESPQEEIREEESSDGNVPKPLEAEQMKEVELEEDVDSRQEAQVKEDRDKQEPAVEKEEVKGQSTSHQSLLESSVPISSKVATVSEEEGSKVFEKFKDVATEDTVTSEHLQDAETTKEVNFLVEDVMESESPPPEKMETTESSNVVEQKDGHMTRGKSPIIVDSHAPESITDMSCSSKEEDMETSSLPEAVRSGQEDKDDENNSKSLIQLSVPSETTRLETPASESSELPLPPSPLSTTAPPPSTSVVRKPPPPPSIATAPPQISTVATTASVTTVPIVSLLALTSSSSKAPPTSSLPPPSTSSPKEPSLSTIPSLSSLAAKTSSLSRVLPTFESPRPDVGYKTDTIVSVKPKSSKPRVCKVAATSVSPSNPVLVLSGSGVETKSSLSGSNGSSLLALVSKNATTTSTLTASIPTRSATTFTPSALASVLSDRQATIALPTTAAAPSSTSAVSAPSISLTSSSALSSSLVSPLRDSQPLSRPNPISVITQISIPPSSSAKTSSVTPYSSLASAHRYAVVGMANREQSMIVSMGAERLKVGEAEILQASGDSDLHLQQQKIEVKSREEMMGKVPPQVAVIPPIIDLTRTPEYSQVDKLKGRGDRGKVKSPPLLVGVAGSPDREQKSSKGEGTNIDKPVNVLMSGQEVKGHIGEMKSSTHPVARRIWMSSCRPLDPASLERIGVDSKGTVYWYDGGKNMFQSPPTNDPAYKPSESELQLSCKSMVQWTAKLKDLRHSNAEADVKLAQIIKDQFLSRVRIATQRKPRDMTVIQKLQAVHSLRQPAQLSQQSTVSTKQTVALTTSQAAAAVAAGAVTMATGGGESPGNITAQKAAQIVQGSFPQGSILVVPHPTHPFHAVLPVFANTAVLMPQAAATVSTATTNSTSLAAVSHTAAGPTVSVAVAEKRTNDKQLVAGAVPGESDASKLSAVSYPVATATAGGSAAQTILVQTPSGSSQPISAIQVSPSSVIQLSSGSRNNVPAGMMVSSERAKESLSVSKERLSSSSTPSKEKPPESEVSPRPHQQQPQKGGLAAALSSPQTATIALHPSLIPQALASGMLTAVQGGGVKFQDYRQALALSGVPVMPVMPVKVGEPVKLSTIDFESQSIEITGEVPIKKVEVDSKTGEFIPVPLTAVTEPPSNRERMEIELEKSGPTLTSIEADKSLSVSKVQKTAEEDDSHVDVEGESKQVGAAKSPAKVSGEEKGGAFSGHTSSDILSAQLLLALTDGHRKDWTSGVPPSTEPQEEKSKTGSPVKALLSREASIVLTPVPLMKTSSRDETASPASSTSQTAVSGGRKRKQKPIASAKPDDKEVESTAKTTPTPRGRKGARKVKQVAEEEHVVETAKSSAKKKQLNDKTSEKETPVKSKQLSPEELLVLLDIPPSGGKASAKNKTPISKPKGKTKDKPNQDGRSVLQSSNATANAKMEELKATRAEKPMKEYVIETDSDSDSSSSATSSSRFSPDSGSSSESSSDSSSDEGGGGGGEGERGEGSETKVKPLTKKVPVRATKVGVARGRGISGRGGRVQRKGKKEASSSADSSSEEEERAEETGQSKKKPTRGGRRGVTRSAARGGARSSGRGGRVAQQENKQEKRQRGHIVSIPTNLLTHKPQTGKKRKAVSREAEVEKATTADYIPDLPVDLATFYATKGGVDLGTLSELTNSVKEEGSSGVADVEVGVSRSKRTCVRMREEISKLQEILKDSGSPEVRPSPPTRPRGRGKGRASSGKTSDTGGGASVQELATPTTSAPAPAKKYRRPAYSQFTHKRRKRRRKQPEEEALWQPASRPGESYKPVYLFSTFLANKAAAAVEKSRYNTIIQFHQAQPKDPGFLRLPPTTEKQSKPSQQQQRGSASDRKQTDGDTGEEETSAKETRGGRGLKRRSSGQGIEGGVSTRRTRTSEVEPVNKPLSPQPFLRSSRRLKQQRNRSVASPPPLQSPTSDGPRSPLPPSPPTGVRPRPRRSSQTTPSTGESGGTQQQQQPQRSLRRKRNNLPDESPTSPLPDMFETTASQEVEEMDSPSDEEERRTREEEECSDGDFGTKKKPRLDGGSDVDKNVISSPGLQSPEQQRSVPPPTSREEENYTICHGTPINKSAAGNDISSPKNWSQQQQQQHASHLQQQHHLHQLQQQAGQYPPPGHQSHQQQIHQHHQMQQYAAAVAQAGGHPQPHHPHRAPTTPSSEAVTFSSPVGQLHPGSSSSPVGSQFEHRSAATAGLTAAGVGGATAGLNGGSGTAGRNIQAEYAQRHHLMAAEHAHHREAGSSWAAAAAGLHPQFAGVPGAYPGTYPPMYTPAGIPGMQYPGQPVPSANYPYPMPYHWGHPHASPQFASHGDHMIQQQQQQQQQHHAQQQHRQATASKDVSSHHDVLQHPHISGRTSDSPHSASHLMRGQHASGSSSTQSVNVTSSSTAVGKASSRGHYPSPGLHQLSAPGSASPHALSHQVPHGSAIGDHHLPPGPHQPPPFPYGFDSSAHSLSHMHMLQQSQMQPPQLRSLPGVPPHHLPPHMASRGLWYSPQHMAAHQMLPSGAGEIPGHPAHPKKSSKSSKSAASADLDKNRNANNNNAQSANFDEAPPTNHRAGPTQEFISAVSYKSALMYPSPEQPTGAAFSVDRLAAPYSAAQLVGVATPPLPLPRQRFPNHEVETSLPAVSVILERTRQAQ